MGARRWPRAAITDTFTKAVFGISVLSESHIKRSLTERGSSLVMRTFLTSIEARGARRALDDADRSADW